MSSIIPEGQNDVCIDAIHDVKTRDNAMTVNMGRKWVRI